jgi:hypothetical protein
VDQHALSSGKLRMLEERLPGCQRRKRQRCGLQMGDTARLQSQIDRPDCRELSSRAVTRKISKSIDLIADPKISYIGRRPLHYPRNLMPQNAGNSWRPVGVPIRLVPGQFRGRDASSTHLHEHIATSDLRQRCLLEKYLLRPARAMRSGSFHENPSFCYLPAGRVQRNFGGLVQHRLRCIVANSEAIDTAA